MPEFDVITNNLFGADQAAQQDFERATRQAFRRDLISWLTRKDNNLLPFEMIDSSLPFEAHYVRRQVVPLDQIVGSVGRCGDFDRAFFPRQNRTKDRWLNVDQARHRQISLPPVQLLQVGLLYFVEDGHHRISVARAHCEQEIEAEVTVLRGAGPLPCEQAIAAIT